jgi:hypothetical protein
MTPMAGPGSSWAIAPPAYGPTWGSGGAGIPNDPFGGREPIGGLPPLVLPPAAWPHVPPGDGVIEPPPITPVPEPGTWALMLGGLALLVSLSRLRERAGRGNGDAVADAKAAPSP